MSTNGHCPVCEEALPAPPASSDYGNRESIECPRCGRFTIVGGTFVREAIEKMDRDVRVNLSAWIRTQCRPDLEIMYENLKEICESFKDA